MINDSVTHLNFVNIDVLLLKIKNYYRNYFANLHVGFQILTSLLVVFLIYQIASTSLQPFIYFQF